MKKFALLIILGALLLAGQPPVRAASPTSDWPSLNADAGQTNSNPNEQTFTSQNALKLKVKWSAPMSASSYPIVANGKVYIPIDAHSKIHVRVLDADTGKQVVGIPKDAAGGMVAAGNNIYLAGHVLQAVDGTTGNKLVQINASPQVHGGLFSNPVFDHNLILTGYATTSKITPTRLYAVDQSTNQVSWKAPSLNATTAAGSGKILTQTLQGTSFYDEASGKAVSRVANFRSPWFAGDTLLYTVATVGKANATLYGYTSAGHRVWKRAVGPHLVATNWPHAFTPGSLYVETLKPGPAIEALDPMTGAVQWSRPVANIQRMVAAGNLLFVVTYGLGTPVKLVILEAGTGKPIGAIELSSGYFYFNSANGLMVADGKVFIRVVGPNNVMQLLALGV